MNTLFELFYKSSGVSKDTRTIEKDNLYIGIKGPNFDGGDYAQQAIEKGAKYAIVQNKNLANGQTIFYVNDTLLFLQELANYHRAKFKIPVIGITGSNGKTTTKELIASVLEKKYNVLYTKGNLNNHIGVPLTLLNMNNEHDIAIIEMGANKPGDIIELAEIADPTHGIITNIGKAHLEGFGGLEGVIATKKGLYEYVAKIGGTLFANGDDEILLKHLPKNIEVIYYSMKSNAYVNGKLIELTPEVNYEWRNADYSSGKLTSKIIGKYNFTNMLAAICIGSYFEVEPALINDALTNFESKNNRSQVEKTLHNTLILDAYNANPTSVQSALESFALMDHSDKLFVLGDMYELGQESQKLHEEIIQVAQKLNLQGIFVGKEYFQLAEKFPNFVFHPTKEEAKNFFSVAHPKGNLILLKGSRGIGLEELVGFL